MLFITNMQVHQKVNGLDQLVTGILLWDIYFFDETTKLDNWYKTERLKPFEDCWKKFSNSLIIYELTIKSRARSHMCVGDTQVKYASKHTCLDVQVRVFGSQSAKEGST